MGLLLTAAITVISVNALDLHSPRTYISEATRASIASGDVSNLSCIDLSKRSKRVDRVCLSDGELAAAYDLAQRDARYERNIRGVTQSLNENWRSKN